MVSPFERLEKGRPPQTEEPVKQSRRHADQKALIKDVLANGPAPPLRQLAEQFAAQVVCAVVERDKRNAFEQHCPDTLFGFLHAFSPHSPDSVLNFAITSAGHASNGSRKARARSSGHGCHAGRSRPTPCGSSFMCSPTILGISSHACDAGADQGLVADEPKGEADQDRREGGEPRTLRRLPNGGGRHPTTNVPGDSAADRGTTAAATTRASMKRRLSRVQEQSTGGMRPDASENSQISPSTIVRAARAAGSHPHLASVLLQAGKREYLRQFGSHPGNPGY